MLRAFVTIVLGVTGAYLSATPRGLAPIVNYSPADVGAETFTMTAVQDRDGVLYFGGRQLLWFDGERWAQASAPEVSFIVSLDFGPDNKLWAACTTDVGYFERTDDTWKYRSLTQYLPKEHQAFGQGWRAFANQNGATFVTQNRIMRWDGHSFKVWEKPGMRRLPTMRTGDTLLVHYPPEGLYAMNESGPNLVLSRDVLGDAIVLWADHTPSGWLLGTADGFFACDGKRLTPFAPSLTPYLREKRLTTATRLRDGRIVVGTLRGGLALVGADGAVERYFTPDDGLSSAYVTNLFVDRDGQLWVSTHSQIARMDVASRATVFDTRLGLPRVSADLITQGAGAIVVASETGAHAWDANKHAFVAISGISGGLQMLQGSATELLAGGYRGLVRWDGQDTTPIFDTQVDVFAAARSRKDPRRLILSTQRSLVAIGQGAKPETLTAGLPAEAQSLAEDAHAGIWMGTAGQGVFLLTAGEAVAQRIDGSTSSYLLPKQVGPTHVRSTPRGDVFVITGSGAWFLVAGENRFRGVASYVANEIAAVSPTTLDGAVWVLHAGKNMATTGVSRLVIHDALARAETKSLDSVNAIGAAQCLFAEVDPAKPSHSTTLWIGGMNGVLRHEIHTTAHLEHARAPLIRAFARDGKSGAKTPLKGALPYTTGSIALEFATTEYSRRATVRLESLIEGIDLQWVPCGPGATRELAGTRDGNYLIRARSVTAGGAISPESKLQLEILPPWWRTRAARALEAIGIMAVVVGGYRFRVRSLRRRNAELEAKVRQRTEELERASAAKTVFVANMSHDIRNPLNGIVGLALALEDTRLEPRQREIVATLRECTTYLSSLVDDVLDFASIEAGKVELRPGAFAPADLLQSIVTTLKADTAERGATLHVECAPDLAPALMGDAGRIQQILVNYVSNALKYAGGEIHLRAHVPANSPDEIEFSVTDRGQGISPEEQATLFTKFSRLEGARRDEIAGTGLGLAACRLLADLMGGAVGVTSVIGQGSRFFLRLPLTVAVQEAPAADTPLPNSTVLLVEDTDYNAWAASAVLAKLNLTCERARTGEEALRMFSERRFNIVLLDRNLPDMDGTEVARRLRALETENPSGPSSIILAVTAYCTAADRQLCLDAGMDAFVGKPLTPAKLRKVLVAAGRRLLATATLQAEPEALRADIDTSLLTYLADDTPEGLATQIERFLATLSETKNEIAQAANILDFETLATAAHKLLGQARLVGGGTLAAAITRLESAAREADGSACAEWLRRVDDEIRELTAALQNRRISAQPA